MIYRPRASSLHAARAGVAIAWLAAIGLVVLACGNPVVLGAVLVVLVVVGARARVGRELARTVAYAVPVAALICLVNALVTRQGFTVIWHFGDLPVLGETNVTLEATVYGAILGLRAVELILVGALYSLAVDPDEVLRMMRRISFGSALSATIATRMIPILVRDGRRLADAQRCRPGTPPGRLVLMRATTSGVLDRALDVAAALEVRGYSAAHRNPPWRLLRRRRHSAGSGRPAGGSPATPGRPYSRHDLAFLVSTTVIVADVVVALVAGLTPFRAYPSIYAPVDPGVLAVASVLAFAILAPTLSNRGVQR